MLSVPPSLQILLQTPLAGSDRLLKLRRGRYYLLHSCSVNQTGYDRRELDRDQMGHTARYI